MKVRVLLAIWLSGFLSPVILLAQIPGPKIVPHVVPHDPDPGPSCENDPVSASIRCSDFITYGNTCTAYDLYMVAGQADSNGVAGITIGIDYDGEHQSGADVLGWQLCATGLEFPSDSWPDAGSGSVMTWNLATCGLTEIPPDGVHATAGVFYVYAYSNDTFAFTANSQFTRPRLSFANCIGQEWDLDPLLQPVGFAQFGGGWGCNPCNGYCYVSSSRSPIPQSPCPGVPVKSVSWGRIKGFYK